MSEEISLLIEGTAFMVLRGRITLRILRTFKLGRPGTNSIVPVITAMKSIQFQGSLK